jgi:predicted transcriptional regulator
MEIRLRPELEASIASHRTEIESKIDEGYAAAQRGELVDPEEVRARLDDLKPARLQQ